MSGSRLLSKAARLSKLRAMSAAEIVHRLRYAGLLAAERRQHAAGALTPHDRLRRALRADLDSDRWSASLLASRRSNRHRFFSSIGAPGEMRILFSTEYRSEYEAMQRQAAATREHRFAFFGQEFAYSSDIDWQCDPVSGRSWPRGFHANIPVHSGDSGFGDVKHVWELSRQQFLVDLGKAWFLSGNADDLTAVRRLVRSWVAGNPYATGVNWACALEPAFRVFSWLWTYFLTADDLDDEFHVEWLEAFHDHGRFLERHLELYSSPYNHLVAEAAALYMLGLSFPEFRDADRWRSRGRDVLEGRLSAQFYADGGSVEQSTFYHHATVGFYLLAGLLGRGTGDHLSPAVWAAIERGLDFSLALMQPDGRTPAIGGADDGKPIRMEHLPFWDFRPYLAIGAVVFDRPDFKYAAGRFHEDALWLLGPGGRAKFAAITPKPPARASAGLPSSGYHVLRSGWSHDADYVLFDCGEQAAGMRPDGVPNSMHGHADCLSVVVHLRGRPVLVDSGLFAYNCGGEWESHFRETAAHNTAKVDGRDQAKHIRKMAWSHSYRATLEGRSSDSVRGWVLGSHDGFARGPDGVTHRRAVWLGDAYVLMYDEFTGSGDHELTMNFQFAPGDLVAGPDGRAVLSEAIDLAWLGRDVWRRDSQCGGPSPGDGWIAPSLGLRQAAPRLRLTCRTAASKTTLLTVVATRVETRTRVSIMDGADLAGEAGRLAIIACGDSTDIAVAGGVAPAGLIDTDAPLAVIRMKGDGSVESDRVAGTRLRFDAGLLRRVAVAAKSGPMVCR